MGFLDGVFDDDGFLGRLKETLEDAAWFVGAPADTAFDMARAALPGGDPALGTALKELGEGFQQGTQLFFGDQNDLNTEEDDENNLLNPVLGEVLDGLEWVYDEGITPAVSTPIVMQQRLLGDIQGADDGQDPWYDVKSAWNETDEGNRSSIGREMAYLWAGLGNNSALTEEGQKLLDEQSKMFDVVSGTNDAMARLLLDPLILVGKAGKLGRLAAEARVKDPTKLPELLSKQGDALFTGFGKRFDQAAEWMAEQGRTAPEMIAAFPGLRDGNGGEQVASLLESTNRALYKAGATKAEVREQQALISRAWVGDGVALQQIDDKAIWAKDALAAMKSDRDDLKTALEWTTKYAEHATPEDIEDAAQHLDVVKHVGLLGRDYFASDEFLSIAEKRLGSVTKDVEAAKREAARQEKLRQFFHNSEGKVGKRGAGSDRPLLAGALSEKVPFIGGTKGLEKRAARERGELVGFDIAFQTSAWNKPVKVGMAIAAPHLYVGAKAVGAFRSMAQPRKLSVHDPNAAQTLDTFLKHSKLTPEVRLQLVSEMARATDENSKRIVVEKAIQNAERSMIAAYKAKNPHFTEETEKLVNQELAKLAFQNKTRQAAHLQRFSVHQKDDGTPGDTFFDEETNSFVTVPLLDTQLVNEFPLPNLREVEHVLHRHSNTLTDMAAWAKGDRLPDQNRVKEIAARVFDTAVAVRPGLDARTASRLQTADNFRWATEEFAKLGLGAFNKGWKVGVLGTRPLAWVARVLTDSDMRAMAVLGPTSFLKHSAPRAAGFLTMGGASRAKQAFMANADARMDDKLRESIERFEDTWRAGSDEPIASPEYDELKAQHAEVQKRLKLHREGGRQGRREAYGIVGEIGQKDIKTRAGNIPGAFAGEVGRMNRWAVSADISAQIFGDSKKLAMKDAGTGQWVYLEHGDPGHMESWLHAVNAQVLQSTLGKKALQFMDETGDREAAAGKLAAWMNKDPEGRQLQRRLAWRAADKRVYSREVVGMVNHLLPSSELRQKALSGKRVQQVDLEQAFPDPTLRPPVHGEQVAAAMGKEGFWARVDRAVSRYMDWVGNAPEDQLARHPMYAAKYEQEVKRRSEFLLADPTIDRLSEDDIKRLIQDQAHATARQTIKNYMFDIAATSDLTHFAQYVSPFIAAWEDTIRKWGRIAKENPDIPGKLYLAWNAPNDMGLVVDEEWDPVDDDNFNDAHHVILQWPSWIPGDRAGKTWRTKDVPVVGKYIGDSQMRLPKQSLNIILQGGLQPGFGPLVAYPVGKIQTQQPQMEDIAKFVNPYGPPDSFWDAVAPSVFKRTQELVDSNSKAHTQDTFRIYRQMLHQHRLDPERYPLPDDPMAEAAKRAKGLGVLKILNNMNNPFPVIYDSPFQLQIDAYHDLNERQRTEDHPYGWADEQFLQGYGEAFFILVESLSRNNGGLPASVNSQQAMERYKKAVSKYGFDTDGQPNSTLIRLIAGAEAEGPFSQSAHRWQLTNEISPGTGVTFRDYEDPLAATADADVDLGWLKYRQFTNTIDAQALSQGLDTYRDDEELVETRKQFIANLKAENPAWGADFTQMDTGKFERNLAQLSEVAKRSEFEGRSDMQGVQHYLALRQALQQTLAENEITPGSQDALPYKQEFTDAVMQLVSHNTSFAEWSYYQFLERDPLLAPDDAPTAVSVGSSGGDWGF